MRAALIALALLCGTAAVGCGSARHTTTVAPKRTTQTAPPSALRVGVVGHLELKAVPGAWLEPGELATMPAYPLVVVSADAASMAEVEDAAALNPTSHYVYVGASTKDHPHPNLVGVVLDEAQAAQLGGAVAGLVAAEESGHARVAWVGDREDTLAEAFTRGAQSVNPGVTVLRPATGGLPASCKEGSLSAIARGAVVTMAHGGLCADAAVAGAHQQNHVGLRLSDFELPSVAVGVVIADAVSGVYRGGEDIVFGASSGAIGVRRLDPRISVETGVRARAVAQQLASGLRASG